MQHALKYFTATILTILLLAFDATAQTPPSALSTATLEGKVTETRTGEALTGATVFLKGTPFGSTTNTNGGFKITAPAGDYTLEVRLIGYETLEKPVSLATGKVTKISLSLAEAAVEGKEVQVSAQNQRQQKEDVRTSLYSIQPEQVKTLAGGVEDVLRSLQSLPGVVAQNDFSSQLVIRGSGPDQNLIVMDDIEIFNPYQLYSTISIFNPETVSDITLLTGGFPAKYGDRLSAVLDVTNRDGNKDKPASLFLNLNITDANAIVEGRNPFGLDGSWLFSSRRTYYDLILGPVIKKLKLVDGDVQLPNFADFQSKIVFQLSPQHRLLFNAFVSSDGVDVVTGERTNQRPDSVSVQNVTRNDAFGAAWHWTPNKDFLSKFVVSYYNNSGASQFGGEFLDPYNSINRDSLKNLQGNLQGKNLNFLGFSSQSNFAFKKTAFSEEMSYHTGQHFLEGGAGFDLLTTTIFFNISYTSRTEDFIKSLPNAFPSNISQSKEYFRWHVYGQDKIELFGKRFYIQPGLRLDYYRIIDRFYLSPRLDASFALDPITTLRGAVGYYAQSPGYEKLIDQNQFFDLSQNSSFITSLRAEKAFHYVLGVDRWIDNKWLIKVEGYYKVLWDVLVQKLETTTVPEGFLTQGTDPNLSNAWTVQNVTETQLSTTPINAGNGQSYGLELLLEKRNVFASDKLSGWLTYSLSWSKLHQYGYTVPFQYDQRHTANVILNYKINSWLDLGSRFVLGSGFAYTPVIGVKPRINALTGNVQTDDNDKVIYNFDYGGVGNINSARLPVYHRLDMRATAHTKFWSGDWSFYLDVINIYNHTNVLGYSYTIMPQPDALPVLNKTASTQFPIVPTIGLSAKF
jgi:hypothetical protein